MQQKPSIIYMGTPYFAVAPLKALLDNQFEVKAVVTVPDKPAGRGRKLQQSAVKEFALEHNLPVLQPEKLRNPEFLNQLEAYNADLFIVIAFRMLPKAVWDLPQLGTFNIHGSLLPHYRGAAPINWAIINGEEKTGVTSFFINEKIDSGAIIDYREREIMETDTAGSLHDQLMLDAAELIISTIHKITKPDFKEVPQDLNTTFKEAPKIFKPDCLINWNNNARDIYNFIRGLSPYPVAFSNVLEDGNEIGQIRILKTLKSEKTLPGLIGSVTIENGKMFVKCNDTALEIVELQWPGKKRMTTKSFLNGFRVAENLRLQ